MKERPIIFSTDMVKAILDDRKTQTRRIIKWDIKLLATYPDRVEAHYIKNGIPTFCNDFLLHCPYGQVSNGLWVRETWQHIKAGIAYKASWNNKPDWKWRSPLFMPRWASRITLEVTEVRVERVQGITPEDCILEGLDKAEYLKDIWKRTALTEFRIIWDSLNAKRGYGWDSNPWVWVISFKKVGKE
ncbi:hypothetical protein ES704_01970 [subsurface metagenome]|jgi:hypothetical protein